MRSTLVCAALAALALVQPGAHGRAQPTAPGLQATVPDRVTAIVNASAALPRLRAVIVAHRGRVVAERRHRGPPLDAAVNVKSVSKSVISALVGIAIAEGKLEGVDQKIGGFFARELAGDPEARKRDITIGDLLTMRSGLERTSGQNYGAFAASKNWVRHVLARPLLYPPGTQMLYSTGNTHLLSAILTKATGKSTHRYAQQKLGTPLGIRIAPWQRDPQGIFVGGNQMRLSPRALLRFGELYRNGGRHGGRQVVLEAWVRASFTSRTRSPFSGEQYGYGWFVSETRGHALYYAWGYGGQFVFIVPELELTLVTTSDPTGPRDFEHLGNIYGELVEPVVAAFETPGEAG